MLSQDATVVDDNGSPNIVVKLVEVLYVDNEPIKIADDVYSLCIAANLTGNCSP